MDDDFRISGNRFDTVVTISKLQSLPGVVIQAIQKKLIALHSLDINKDEK
ncbi:hypothetical protein Lepto7375DRAFT_3162 [Leptolyngbya sp. PCC 7375]|nr:hypothetical protein Lepto7375DRAFT_3162 [Leptolyngbya sp. PCC 7375]